MNPIFKSNAAKLLVENRSYFLGITQKALADEIQAHCKAQMVIDEPTVRDDRTAKQNGRYIEFSNGSKLDLGARGITCYTDDINNHTILYIHREEQDSFDGSVLHKWMYYLIL